MFSSAWHLPFVFILIFFPLFFFSFSPSLLLLNEAKYAISSEPDSHHIPFHFKSAFLSYSYASMKGRTPLDFNGSAGKIQAKGILLNFVVEPGRKTPLLLLLLFEGDSGTLLSPCRNKDSPKKLDDSASHLGGYNVGDE